MEKLNIESFECLAIKGQSKKAIVVLHGYGANNRDLIPIKDYIKNHESFSWFFVNAPLELPMMPGFDGRAWFELRVSEMQAAILEGKGADFFGEVEPPGLREVSEKILKLIRSIKADHDEVYLGGFSQGSMVSFYSALLDSTDIYKLFLLSSTIVDKKLWDEKGDSLKQLSIYQSHGTSDPVLPVIGAYKLKEILDKFPQYRFREFSGGHEIPLPIIEDLSEFLNA